MPGQYAGGFAVAITTAESQKRIAQGAFAPQVARFQVLEISLRMETGGEHKRPGSPQLWAPTLSLPRLGGPGPRGDTPEGAPDRLCVRCWFRQDSLPVEADRSRYGRAACIQKVACSKVKSTISFNVDSHALAEGWQAPCTKSLHMKSRVDSVQIHPGRESLVRHQGEWAVCRGRFMKLHYTYAMQNRYEQTHARVFGDIPLLGQAENDYVESATRVRSDRVGRNGAWRNQPKRASTTGLPSQLAGLRKRHMRR
ncbi:hypothetical protein N657DRAFT_629931 [Parathielavia appendiculata]|uniref:Uncharacterized protein n=1 Tax=Parathielavia appendiculata TaxID=2587402 RepID=A0AAN6UC97_9PEZI|nr:hypothetical protein N657DRAFT_629931 [Parathielavia appendiculata]